VGKWAKMPTNGTTMRVCGFDKSGQKVGRKWAKWAEKWAKHVSTTQNTPKNFHKITSLPTFSVPCPLFAHFYGQMCPQLLTQISYNFNPNLTTNIAKRKSPCNQYGTPSFNANRENKKK
jgi:hypothetical protein